ncbi:MAG: hypothetical protein IPO92_14460 [Saprospiraceae bacterium]|nr:hypothetical protein [Saprospiraceae bacterium]
MNRLIPLAFIIVALFSCTRKKIPDVSHLTSDVQIIRTENDIMMLKDKSSFEKLFVSHPAFYDIYLKEVLQINTKTNSDSSYRRFDAFIKDSLIVDLASKVQKRYKDLSNLKHDIDQMYRYAQYYFPNQIFVPKIYTFISEFAYQMFIIQDDDGNDGIALGLDMFMSPDIDYKLINPDNTNFSDYITRTWNQDNIVKKIVDLHVNDLLGEAPGSRLLDQMIHQGKAMYISKLLLPLVHDSIITEYTGKQMAWCAENELQMWSFFFDQKLFYESNPVRIGKYINPSPNSPDMPPSAPGRTASYIGWKIVNAYMERYPDTSLNELIDMKDSQALMDKSKYKPKQKK